MFAPLRRLGGWLGCACAGAFALVVVVGVTVGALTSEHGPAEPERDGVPPAVEFGDDRVPGYEREMGR